jgi:hypothetical protein
MLGLIVSSGANEFKHTDPSNAVTFLVVGIAAVGFGGFRNIRKSTGSFGSAYTLVQALCALSIVGVIIVALGMRRFNLGVGDLPRLGN